jgi:hypothetical protein
VFWRNDEHAARAGAVEQAVAAALPKLEAELAAKLRTELDADLRARHAAALARHAEDVDALLREVRASAEADPQARARLWMTAIGDDLRRQVATAETMLGDLRARLTDLEGLEREAVALIESLERRTGAQGVRGAPEQVDLGELRQAKRFAIVTLWFDGGGTDVVELRVGFDPPPEHVVGRVNSRNKLNSSLSTIVRPGEWWATSTDGGEWGSGVKITYTEFL